MSSAVAARKESGSFFSKLLQRVDGCTTRIVFNAAGPDAARTYITPTPPSTSADNKIRSYHTNNSSNDSNASSVKPMPLYRSDEPVRGIVELTPTGTHYTHQGILIELVGYIITTSFDEKEERWQFMRQEQRYEAGTITRRTPYAFDFAANKEHESYHGMSVRLSYLVRATVLKSVKNTTVQAEVWVTCVDASLSAAQPDASLHPSYFRETEFGPNSIAMEVGVENFLCIEFRYDKKTFHLRERLLGKVTFKIADVELRYGEVGIVRKEFLGPESAEQTPVAEQVLQRFEIMDGTPIVGEVVPIRLYLGCIAGLTPTYANVQQRFSVRYYVNLVLVSSEKRYFKRQEIILYRRSGQDALGLTVVGPQA